MTSQPLTTGKFGDAEAIRLVPAADGADGATERSLVTSLSLVEKVRLLTGADSWRTHESPAIGLRSIVTSDGPAGVRGTTKDERSPSACLPCPSALGATWDPQLVYRVAAALGAEARSKDVDVLLAPTVNLMRSPLGGRGFEFFSEDPVLTAALAVGYVRGVQSAGVAATVKHFVANDTETGRRTYDARINESVLHELYLMPFEACVRDGGAWLIMAAYNKVNGARMTESARLLRDVLKNDWGFDGVVVSDWDAALSTEASALATLDLSMPGPDGPWGEKLLRAVADGSVSEDVIDDKVVRLLRLARRVGALGDSRGRPGAAAPARIQPVNGTARNNHAGPAFVDDGLLREAAAASFVLLRNHGEILPLDTSPLKTGPLKTGPLKTGTVSSVAIIGPNALYPVIQGGGSAGVMPVSVATPAQALGAALPEHVEVHSAVGCNTWHTVPEPPAGSLHDPVTGEPGVRLEFIDGDGAVIGAEHRTSVDLAWWDGVPPGVGWGEEGRIALTAVFRAETSGNHLFSAAGVGGLLLIADGVTVIDGETEVPEDPVEAMTRPGELRAALWLDADTQTRLRLEFRPAADGSGPLAVRLGIVGAADDDELLAEAVAAAGSADVAVVVVGSAELTESEGFDRSALALPGRQDELITKVTAVNRNTIVVVNAGMPILMPWAARAAAVLFAWLPGQAFGTALADVLLGRSEPGGRLPVTLPAAESDSPVLHAIPAADGTLSYSEGPLIGYRGYDAADITPRYPFGHGLGYTDWAYESIDCPPQLGAGRDLELKVSLTNTGTRPGKEVVQAYLTAPATAGRPIRVLAGFATTRAAAGESVRVSLTIPARLFARYNEDLAAWIAPDGRYTVHIGRSSRDLRLSAGVQVGALYVTGHAPGIRVRQPRTCPPRASASLFYRCPPPCRVLWKTNTSNRATPTTTSRITISTISKPSVRQASRACTPQPAEASPSEFWLEVYGETYLAPWRLQPRVPLRTGPRAPRL
jgi:beta-glucosidase